MPAGGHDSLSPHSVPRRDMGTCGGDDPPDLDLTPNASSPLLSPDPGNLLLPWIWPQPGVGARGDRTPPRANCPPPDDTTPGKAGDNTEPPSPLLPPRTPQDPQKRSQELHIHPPLDASEPKPPTPSRIGGAGYQGTPPSCAAPPGSHTLPGLGTWGHMGRWYRSTDAVFFSFSQPGFSLEQRGPSRRAGQEGAWSRTGAKTGQFGANWDRVGINTALGTAGHGGQLCPPQDWDDFMECRVWELGWPPKWGFCSQKEFSSPSSWMKQRRRGSAWGAALAPRSWIRLSASCLNPP